MSDLQTKKRDYRISDAEYERILKLLGREPQGVEWSLFSALWSEHCSYKSSKFHLKKLFNRSPRVVQGFGENAGVIDLGGGERVAFKIESHNHPSYIEPYQGAATGVGGIIRDILTMGARPIALGNFLCFGKPEAPRMKSIIDGVVRGIGGYGNCVGVPMLTGHTEFDETYNQNILVNALCVGYFPPGAPVVSAQMQGPGNYLVYIGAKTGRDGIHGARMASESFGQGDEDKRPNVQIGDPFFEKLLIESCLEVISAGLVVSIQDMGAAGLISSSFEMASKGGVGFVLDLDQVPLRDSTMTPEEILVSESQERMLAICEPKQFSKLREVFHQWGLEAVRVGQVTAEPMVRIQWHGETLTHIDPNALVENAPQYERPFELPPKDENRVRSLEDVRPELNLPSETLLKILRSTSGGSREWIFRQYDQRVGGQTAQDCSAPSGILRLPSGRALGIALGGRTHVMKLNPWIGGLDAVAYPALLLAARGLQPLAISDGLNAGNPEKPEVMGDFVAHLRGLDEMARSLETPIISGNVSLYNETAGKGITPTPATVLVGVRPQVEGLSSPVLKESQVIYRLSMEGIEMVGSLSQVEAFENGFYGQLDPKLVAQFVRDIQLLANSPGVEASRVVGKFGLAYSLARMCEGGVGAQVQTDEHPFTERLYEVLFAIRETEANEFERLAEKQGLRPEKLGKSGGSRFIMNSWSVDLASLKKAYCAIEDELFDQLH